MTENDVKNVTENDVKNDAKVKSWIENVDKTLKGEKVPESFDQGFEGTETEPNPVNIAGNDETGNEPISVFELNEIPPKDEDLDQQADPNLIVKSDFKIGF